MNQIALWLYQLTKLGKHTLLQIWWHSSSSMWENKAFFECFTMNYVTMRSPFKVTRHILDTYMYSWYNGVNGVHMITVNPTKCQLNSLSIFRKIKMFLNPMTLFVFVPRIMSLQIYCELTISRYQSRSSTIHVSSIITSYWWQSIGYYHLAKAMLGHS